jgi:DNA-directed RNA polymerase subunit RPC12/RpoP
MFHRITCPSCQHKFSVPEGSMGKLVNCPNCQSPFQAGKSVAEVAPEVPMKMQPAAVAGINKTMLADTEPPAPPIKYNCPRCKKPLESPAAEALTKKPCPACGQRLQVPAAPKAAAPQPALNKTMLALDENQKTEAHVQSGEPPVQARTSSKSNARDEDEKATPAEPKRSSSGMYMAVTVGGLGIFFVGLLACVLAIVFSGGDNRKAQEEYAKAQRELEELKRDIKINEALMKQKIANDQENEKLRASFRELMEKQQRELNESRNRELAAASDQSRKDEIEKRRKQDLEKLDREKAERESDLARKDAENKAAIAKLQSEVAAANQRAANATIVVSQPPPYYPPYHPRYYWGW